MVGKWSWNESGSQRRCDSGAFLFVVEFGDHLLSGWAIGEGGEMTSCLAKSAFESCMVGVVEGILLDFVVASTSRADR
jgi:hypothetical protein